MSVISRHVFLFSEPYVLDIFSPSLVWWVPGHVPQGGDLLWPPFLSSSKIPIHIWFQRWQTAIVHLVPWVHLHGSQAQFARLIPDDPLQSLILQPVPLIGFWSTGRKITLRSVSHLWSACLQTTSPPQNSFLFFYVVTHSVGSVSQIPSAGTTHCQNRKQKVLSFHTQYTIYITADKIKSYN